MQKDPKLISIGQHCSRYRYNAYAGLVFADVSTCFDMQLRDTSTSQPIAVGISEICGCIPRIANGFDIVNWLKVRACESEDGYHLFSRVSDSQVSDSATRKLV